MLKIKIPALLILAALLLPLPTGLYAAGGAGAEPSSVFSYKADVVYDMSRSLLEGRADILDDMGSAGLWAPLTGTGAVSAATSFDFPPFEPFEGTRCLSVASGGTPSWSYIERTYASPVNFTPYLTLCFTVSFPELFSNSASGVLILYSESGESYRADFSLISGCWNGVFADISSFSGRKEITRIRIGFYHRYEGENTSGCEFAVDCLAASADRNLSRAVRFMSGQYTVYGGESRLTYESNPEKMRVGIASTLASKCFIESAPLSGGDMAGCDAIRVRLKNNSSCESVTMEYATVSGPSYADNPQVTAVLEATAADSSGSDCVKAYYFAVSAEGVTQLKFTFNGASEGTVDIYSITPVDYYSPYRAGATYLDDTVGAVESCRLTENGSKISVRGSLTETAAEAYRGWKLELYALGVWQDIIEAVNGALQPIASASVSADFALETSSHNGALICSRFVIALTNREKQMILPLGAPRYITNPENAASESRQYPVLSDKGLIGAASALAEAGVSQTVVTCDAGLLLCPESEAGAAGYDFEGKKYFFDSGAIAALDAAVKEACAAGAAVTLRLTLSQLGHPEYSFSLIHPDAITRPSTSYAFNTETEEGVTLLRAVCDFLARRYMASDSSNGRAVGLIVGKAVGDAYENYNMGKKTPAEFADSYVKALRVIYNTVRSVNPRARIYISTGGSWDRNSDSAAALYFCGRDIVDLAGEQIRREGNIFWNLEADPYPDYSGGITGFASGPSEAMRDLTVNGAAAFCAYLRRPSLLYDNSQRRVLFVSDFSGATKAGARAVDYIAEYIAAYYTISSDLCQPVEGFIIKDDGRYSDSGYNFYKIMKYIDTDRAAEFTDFAKDFYSVKEWGALIDGYRSGANAGRLLSESRLSGALPDVIAGSANLFSFDTEGGSSGWTGSSALETVTAANSFKGYKNMLFASFGALPGGTLCSLTNKFEYARDLSYAPYLAFNFYTDNLPDTVKSLTLTVTLYSDGACAEGTASVRGGQWKYVVFDLSGFSAVKNVNAMAVRLNSPAGEDLSGVTLVISEISVSSQKYDSAFLENKFKEEREKYLASAKPSTGLTAAILIAILAAALTAEAAHILSRLTPPPASGRDRYRY